MATLFHFFRYYDDVPIFSGLLFIINKLSVYALSAIFLLDFFTLTNFSHSFHFNMKKENPWTLINKFSKHYFDLDNKYFLSGTM